MTKEQPAKSTWMLLIKPSRGIAKILILLLLSGVLYASHTGHLDVLRELLDNEKYVLFAGKYEITLYKVLKALFIVILLFWAAAAISGFGEARISKMRHLKRSTQILLVKLLQIGVYAVAFVIGLDMIGIEMTTLAVFGGALGIGIGFGLQKITSNFISGLILLFEKTINQDDLIELQGGFTGYVRRISSRFTLIETFDGKDIMVPNEDFITNQVVNWTYTNRRARVEIPVSVAYDSDIDTVQQLILEAARNHPRCAIDPEPACYLSSVGSGSVDFLLYFWVSDVTEGRLRPRSEVLIEIWRKLRANGIEVPFPQRDIHIRTADGLPLPAAPAADSDKPAKDKAQS